MLLPSQWPRLSRIYHCREKESVHEGAQLTKQILKLFELLKNGKGEKVANRQVQSKGREREKRENTLFIHGCLIRDIHN